MSAPTRRRTARGEATRERLVDAARELVSEEGYGATSVASVADRAGVATGALYRHFPSKGELYAEVFRRVCSGELAAMRAADEDAPAGTGAVDRLDAVLQTFAGRALASPRLAWALIAEPVDPLVDAERLAYRRRYTEGLAVLVEEAVAAGEVPDQDPGLVAAALVGGVGEALVGPCSPLTASPPPKEAVMQSLSTFVRRAIGAPA